MAHDYGNYCFEGAALAVLSEVLHVLEVVVLELSTSGLKEVHGAPEAAIVDKTSVVFSLEVQFVLQICEQGIHLLHVLHLVAEFLEVIAGFVYLVQIEEIVDFHVIG